MRRLRAVVTCDAPDPEQDNDDAPDPVPDVSDDPHAFLDAVANDPGERFKSDGQKRLDSLVSRLPDGFRSSADFRAKPTPFLFGQPTLTVSPRPSLSSPSVASCC